jgi:hypothetical protein
VKGERGEYIAEEPNFRWCLGALRFYWPACEVIDALMPEAQTRQLPRVEPVTGRVFFRNIYIS